MMTNIAAVIFCAAAAVVNLLFYLSDHTLLINLGAAIFCFLLFIVNLTQLSKYQ